MTEIDLDPIQNFLDRELEGRLVRNVTKSTVHVSSFHNLSKEEVLQVVTTSQQMEDFTNPGIVAQVYNASYLEEKDHKTLRLTAVRMAIASLAKLKEEFDPKNRIHNFIIDIACSAAFQASMELSLIAPDDEIESPFEKKLGYYVSQKPYRELNDQDIKQIKGVCIEPRQARLWIDTFKEGYKKATSKKTN